MRTGWLKNQLAWLLGITRHQLLVDPGIPYTSHNSSACLAVETEKQDEVWEAAREFLLRESAVGSMQVCLAEWNAISAEVLDFGAQGQTRSVDSCLLRSKQLPGPEYDAKG
ncbi:MAG: hypothetical protein IPO22_02810 [Anaerolineales bacterium]|nr:hypothetical protein [Anaerolineales bacterium]